MKAGEALGLAIIGAIGYYAITHGGEAAGGGSGGSGGYSGGFTLPRITISPKFPIHFAPNISYPSFFLPDTERLPLTDTIKQMEQKISETNQRISRIMGKGGEFYDWGGGGWIPYEQRPWSERLAENVFYARHPETAALLAKSKTAIPKKSIDFFNIRKRIGEGLYSGVTKTLKLTVGERLGGTISEGVRKIVTHSFKPFGKIPAGGTSIMELKRAPLVAHAQPLTVSTTTTVSKPVKHYSSGKGYYAPGAWHPEYPHWHPEHPLWRAIHLL